MQHWASDGRTRTVQRRVRPRRRSNLRPVYNDGVLVNKEAERQQKALAAQQSNGAYVFHLNCFVFFI